MSLQTIEAPANSSAATCPTRIVAIANQKGGVGKTTTAVNLATALAQTGRSVLLIDIDPQGSASTSLGFPPGRRGEGSYAVLTRGLSVGAAARPTAIENLSAVTAAPDLTGAEIELVDLPRREFRLRDALDPVRATGRFAYIIMDCPPGLGLLTLNGLVAAESVLVPLQCEFFALEGISQLMRSIEMVRHGMNPELALEGILLTMFDGRNNLCEQVATDVRGFFGPRVFETVIPRNVRLSEAPSHGQPALLYDPRCAGALAYVGLAEELLGRAQARLPRR